MTVRFLLVPENQEFTVCGTFLPKSNLEEITQMAGNWESREVQIILLFQIIPSFLGHFTLIGAICIFVEMK